LSANLEERIGHFEFKTLLTSSSAFLQELKFFCTRLSNWSYMGSWHKQEFFWDKGFFCSANKFQATLFKAGFLQVPPKSSVKRLVLSTGLWQHAKMSTTLKAPNGLKDSECKKGQLRSRPPVPYVPPTDLVTTKEELQSLKIKLPDGSIFNMSIYSWGNIKEYLAHIVAVLRIIRHKGLDVK
jgi:hypothetical protein